MTGGSHSLSWMVLLSHSRRFWCLASVLSAVETVTALLEETSVI